MLPVMILEVNNVARLKKMLIDRKGSDRFLLPAEGKSYRFSPEVLLFMSTSGFPVKSYRIWFHDDWVVCGPVGQSLLWADGIKRWQSYTVVQFAGTLENQDRLAGLAVKVPEELPNGWTLSLISESLPQSDPGAKHITDSIVNLLTSLDGSLRMIDSMAGDFRFVGDTGRILQYAQQFRQGFDGNPVFDRLQSGNATDGHTTIGAITTKLLHHDRLDTIVELHDRRLTVDLAWQAEDDQALLQALLDAVFGTNRPDSTTNQINGR